jgi:cell division protease FtsH
VIDRNYHRAETILQENIEILHKMADALVKWETIDRLQIEDLMAGKDPRPPMDDGNSLVSKTSGPSKGIQDKTDEEVISPNKPAGQV